MSGSSSSPLIIGGVRNSLIGGDFSTNPWQRGTSDFTITGTGQYTADRWKAARGSSASGQTIKYTTLTLGDVPGTRHALRSQRDSGNSSTAICVVAQSIRTLDSLALNNRLITLSFWARAGNDFTGTLAAQIYFGQGTDENVISGFTTATSVTQVCGITPTWQKFTVTTFAGNFTQAGAYFMHTPVGTASTNDWFEIALVQLAPTLPGNNFLFRSTHEEIGLCYSFFQHYNTVGTRYLVHPTEPATPNYAQLFTGQTPFLVPMRSIPTVTIYNPDNSYTSGKLAAFPDTPSELTVDNVFAISKNGFGGITVVEDLTTYYYGKFAFTADSEL